MHGAKTKIINLLMSKTAVKLKLHLPSKFIELKIPLKNPLNAFFIQREQRVSPIYISVICF